MSNMLLAELANSRFGQELDRNDVKIFGKGLKSLGWNSVLTEPLAAGVLIEVITRVR